MTPNESFNPNEFLYEYKGIKVYRNRVESKSAQIPTTHIAHLSDGFAQITVSDSGGHKINIPKDSSSNMLNAIKAAMNGTEFTAEPVKHNPRLPLIWKIILITLALLSLFTGIFAFVIIPTLFFSGFFIAEKLDKKNKGDVTTNNI